MPTLKIDNREVTVPEGSNVLDAAEQLGIVIPHFCYHEALGAIGSCRLCAMQFIDGPVKGLKMACMIPAQDGMVVSTSDPDAMELRAHVIEWLMTNHPHDCPVCDEGGECQLQEMTVAGGHHLRRYRGKKRTYHNQDLGPFIAHEMNRCITCYRCVRTYRDYCGGTDFGVFGSRNRVYFGRYREGRLESPFAGNLVDVCPTGVFTDKTFRFKSRVWDLQEAPSLCPHCSLGCRTIPGGRYRELQRVRAGVNPATNGFFICDRGRFGYGHANHEERPRAAQVDGRVTAMAEGIDAARERIAATVAAHGPESVAFLGSPRASLEANALLAAWARQCGARHLLFEANQRRDTAARLAAAWPEERRRSLAEVRESDCLLLIGADPLAEGPMLAVAIRQAVRAGACVFVIDPRPVELPCRFRHLPLTPENLGTVLKALTGTADASLDDATRTGLAELVAALHQAERPLFIGGADLLDGNGFDALYACAGHFDNAGRQVGIVPLLAGPNSFGAALFGRDDTDFERLSDDLLEGKVKALICLANDPFREACDPARAQVALGRLELLVCIEATPSLAAQRADILLPTRVTAEAAGSYVNNEGRLQAFLPVIEPGLPIRVTGQGGHPPREFATTTPGAAAAADWGILADILQIDVNLDTVRRRIAADEPRLRALPEVSASGEGIRLPGGVAAATVLPTEGDTAAGPLRLLPITTLVGSDWLAHLSAPLAALRPQPTVWLHPRLATDLGLTHEDRAILTTHLGHCHVHVQLSERMVDSLVLVNQLWGSALEGLSPGLPLACRLEKEAGQ
ncbi:MAG: NADH-quinone oxidoreductase subunit NuoG [Desulfuromonadales bacterium]|nr:NADH-quinone oxidoreductase subunit NuoG [Desulfuromonadales bacterium]